MTFERTALDHLCGKGMSAEQAARVLKDMADDPGMDGLMGNRWGADVGGFSDGVMAAFLASVDMFAIAFVDRECPNAWFGQMFAGKKTR